MLGKFFKREAPDMRGACRLFGHVMTTSPLWGGDICKRCGALDCCIERTCNHARAKAHLKASSNIGYYRLGPYTLLKGISDSQWRCTLVHEGAKITLMAGTLAGLRNAVIGLMGASLSQKQLLREMDDYDKARLLEIYGSRPSQGWPLASDGFLLLHGLIFYGESEERLSRGFSQYERSNDQWPADLSEKGASLASELSFVAYDDRNTEETDLKSQRSAWVRLKGPKLLYGLDTPRDYPVYFRLQHDYLKGRYTSLAEGMEAYKASHGCQLIRLLPEFQEPPGLEWCAPTNLWLGGCTEVIAGNTPSLWQYYSEDHPENEITLDLWGTE